jgi:hypothetical protein
VRVRTAYRTSCMNVDMAAVQANGMPARRKSNS